MPTATAKMLNKEWATNRRTREFIQDRGWAEQNVAGVMSWGYYVIDHGPYHVTIQDSVEFWPTRLKWRAPKGYRYCNHGVGMNSLKSYLDEYHPLDSARRIVTTGETE